MKEYFKIAIVALVTIAVAKKIPQIAAFL